MYNTELYNNLIQNQSRQYSFLERTKTLVVCGALLLNSSGPFIHPQARVSLPVKSCGSDGYIIDCIYSQEAPTWSHIDTAYFPMEDMNNDIPETFNVLSKLAFLEGDVAAEEEADQFFSQVQIKTKKIIVRTRA